MRQESTGGQNWAYPPRLRYIFQKSLILSLFLFFLSVVMPDIRIPRMQYYFQELPIIALSANAESPIVVNPLGNSNSLIALFENA